MFTLRVFIKDHNLHIRSTFILEVLFEHLSKNSHNILIRYVRIGTITLVLGIVSRQPSPYA